MPHTWQTIALMIVTLLDYKIMLCLWDSNSTLPPYCTRFLHPRDSSYKTTPPPSATSEWHHGMQVPSSTSKILFRLRNIYQPFIVFHSTSIPNTKTNYFIVWKQKRYIWFISKGEIFKDTSCSSHIQSFPFGEGMLMLPSRASYQAPGNIVIIPIPLFP